MPTEVKMWQTKDGQIFRHQTEAVQHELRQRTIEYFDDNVLYGPYEGCAISGKEFVEFVDDHRQMLKNYLDSIQ